MKTHIIQQTIASATLALAATSTHAHAEWGCWSNTGGQSHYTLTGFGYGIGLVFAPDGTLLHGGVYEFGVQPPSDDEEIENDSSSATVEVRERDAVTGVMNTVAVIPPGTTASLGLGGSQSTIEREIRITSSAPPASTDRINIRRLGGMGQQVVCESSINVLDQSVVVTLHGSSGSLGMNNGTPMDLDLSAPISTQFDPTRTPDIGTNYCQATPNSTGTPGTIAAIGSELISENLFVLESRQLPPGSFCLFLASRHQDFILNPGGSYGNLCLGSPIGRFLAPGQLQPANGAGVVGIAVDLTAIPQATGTVGVAVGETWNFQAWYRDTAGGVAGSNFTDGVTFSFN